MYLNQGFLTQDMATIRWLNTNIREHHMLYIIDIITSNGSKISRFFLCFFFIPNPSPTCLLTTKLIKNSIGIKFHNTTYQGIILTQSIHHNIYAYKQIMQSTTTCMIIQANHTCLYNQYKGPVIQVTIPNLGFINFHLLG